MATLEDARARVIGVVEASAAAALRTAGQDGSTAHSSTAAHLRRARAAAEVLALLDGHIHALSVVRE